MRNLIFYKLYQIMLCLYESFFNKNQVKVAKS
jgi:hypothetical protein